MVSRECIPFCLARVRSALISVRSGGDLLHKELDTDFAEKHRQGELSGRRFTQRDAVSLYPLPSASISVQMAFTASHVPTLTPTPLPVGEGLVPRRERGFTGSAYFNVRSNSS